MPLFYWKKLFIKNCLKSIQKVTEITASQRSVEMPLNAFSAGNKFNLSLRSEQKFCLLFSEV